MLSAVMAMRVLEQLGYVVSLHHWLFEKLITLFEKFFEKWITLYIWDKSLSSG